MWKFRLEKDLYIYASMHIIPDTIVTMLHMDWLSEKSLTKSYNQQQRWYNKKGRCRSSTVNVRLPQGPINGSLLLNIFLNNIRQLVNLADITLYQLRKRYKFF